MSAWNEAFDKIADAACAYGNARLDKAVAELDAQTELAIEARLRPSGNCTFTEYPKEGERPAAVLGDALAAIDAGVDDLENGSVPASVVSEERTVPATRGRSFGKHGF